MPDTLWEKKSSDDILSDIREMAKQIRKQSREPSQVSMVIAPNNWKDFRDAGYIPQSINSWEDFTNWYDKLK